MTAVTANIDKCKAREEVFEFIHGIACKHTPYTELPLFKKKKSMQYTINSGVKNLLYRKNISTSFCAISTLLLQIVCMPGTSAL